MLTIGPICSLEQSERDPPCVGRKHKKINIGTNPLLKKFSSESQSAANEADFTRFCCCFFLLLSGSNLQSDKFIYGRALSPP